jgi:hypothetical protein
MLRKYIETKEWRRKLKILRQESYLLETDLRATHYSTKKHESDLEWIDLN